MTTIIAVQNSNHVIMGSDSQVTSGYEKSSLPQGKIFSNGDYTFGAAGRFRLLQMLQHMDLPSPDGGSLERFMAVDLVPHIERAAKEQSAGFHESAILVAINGSVFEISGDGSVLQSGDGVYSIGSGSTYAKGSLSAVDGEPNVNDVRKALEAAARRDVGTSGPFFIRKI